MSSVAMFSQNDVVFSYESIACVIEATSQLRHCQMFCAHLGHTYLGIMLLASEIHFLGVGTKCGKYYFDGMVVTVTQSL